MKRTQLRTLGIGIVAAIGVSGCASINYQTTWTAPEAHPIDTAPGATVVAVVVQQDEAGRRRSEDLLAAELSERGDLNGVPSYTLISGDDVQNEEAAKAAFERVGAAAAVVMRVVSVDEESRRHCIQR